MLGAEPRPQKKKEKKKDHTSKLGSLMRMKVIFNDALWFNKKIAKG
jgi:hypothetical protein